MSGFKKHLLFLLVVIMLTCYPNYPVTADDERHEKKHKHNEGHLRPVDNPVYKDQCGACHFAYQPELLPFASWEMILANLEDHFGETVDLDDNAKKEIQAYLQSNAAEASSAKRAVKIMQSLGGQVPGRITDIPYIKEKHMGIPPDFFNSKSIGSKANCAACHISAESGIYDDDHVKIPR